MDSSIAPDVLTKVKVGNCLVKIYAYRELTYEECQMSIRKYLLDSRQNELPAKGTVEIYTVIE